MKNNFKFYMPDVAITKGKNEETGEETMIVSGVCSTPEKDMDDEIMDPNGFDLEHFKQYGFVNYHHATKENPGAIVGEPIDAYIKDNKMHLKAELYSWSPIAKALYQLAKGLESSKSKRRLGWSIEGKVMAKDFMNPKKITKAMITGVAITPLPKNPGTFLDVCKGIELGKETYETTANGGKVLILDVAKPDGSRITVDKNFNIKIDKAMSTTSSASVLMPESLDKRLKVLTFKGMKDEDKHNLIKSMVVLYKACECGQITKAQLRHILKGMAPSSHHLEQRQASGSGYPLEGALKYHRENKNKTSNLKGGDRELDWPTVRENQGVKSARIGQARKK